MIKTLTIRLYPTKEQEVLFRKHIGAMRYIYNWALNKNNILYKNKKIKYSSFELSKQLTQYKKECLWLNEISSATLREAIRDLDKAYVNFYKGRSKLPKFKSKKYSKLTFYSRYEKVYFKEDVVNLEKIGKVKYKSSYDINLAKISKFKNPHISFNGRCWVLTIGIDMNNTIEKLTNESLGIDLGIKELAICSNNMVFPNINKGYVIKNLEKRLRRLQRKVSRKYEKNKQGNKYNKTCNIVRLEKQIKKLHRKLYNIRQNYIHQVTSTIVRTKPCRIVMEDLNIKGMMKNKHLSKAIQQQKLYEFTRQMKYKCEWLGIEFIQANRFYPSSKTCSNCGHIKKDLKLSDRTYICEECGLVINRDLNASINLANYR